MPIDLVHFVIWLGLLGVLPPILLRVAAGRLRMEGPLAQLNLWVGPAMLGLVWLHGVLFDPPNNFAMLRDGSMTSYAPDGTLLSSSRGMTFLEFWFHPFRSIDWSPERIRAAVCLGAPAVAWLVMAIFRARRATRHQRHGTGEGRGMIGYFCWILAALLLRHVPDAIMDVPETIFGDREIFAGFLWYAAGVPLLTAAIPLAVAIWLSRANAPATPR